MNREQLIRELWDQVDDLQAMREHWATLDEDQWLAAADQVMGYGDED
jgi:hypothetical protein